MHIILHILRLFCSIPNMSMKMHSHFLTVHLFQILDLVILNRNLHICLHFKYNLNLD